MHAPVAERPEEPHLVLHQRPPAEKSMSDTKSAVLPSAEAVLLQIRIVIVAALQLLARPRDRRPALPFVAADFVTMFRKTPEVGTVMSCAPVDT